MSLLGLNQPSRQLTMPDDPISSGGAQNVNVPSPLEELVDNRACPALGRLNNVLISDLRATVDETRRQAGIAHAAEVAAIETRSAEQLKSAVHDAQMEAKAEFAQALAENAQRYDQALMKLRQELSEEFAETRRQADAAYASQVEKFAAFAEERHQAALARVRAIEHAISDREMVSA